MDPQRDASMLTFENQPSRGTSSIIEKLTVRLFASSICSFHTQALLIQAQSLPFEKVSHKVGTLDAQPANEQGAILVMVTGQLLVDEEQRPMSYSQVFQLNPDGAGSYFVFNDIFRLVYN